MRRFSLRYMLIEMTLIASALGMFRVMLIETPFHSEFRDLLMALTTFSLCGAAIGGLSGRIKGMVIGAVLAPVAVLLLREYSRY